MKFKFITDHLKGYKLLFINVCVVTVLFASVSLMSTLVFGYVIDNVVGDKAITNPILILITRLFGGIDYIRKHLYVIALFLLFIYLFSAIFMHIRQKEQAIVAESLCKNIRDDLYDHIQHLPYSYHVRVKTGELIQKCTSDVDQIRRFFSGQIFEVINIVFTIIIAFIVLFGINTKLALYSAIFYPLIFWYSFSFHKKMQAQFKESDDKESELTTKIQESLSGVRVIKAFNQEQNEIESFEKYNSDYQNTTYKMLHSLGNFWGFSYLFCKLGAFSTIVFGIFFVRNNIISVGDFLIFITYQQQVLWQIRQLGRILSDFSKVTVSIQRLVEIKNEKIENMSEGITPDLNGDIEFKNVSFHYDDDPNTDILNDFSAVIKKGETIAILGPTGSGKSSLIHLLDRLYEPYSGSIFINGHNINEISKEHLRKNIGIVLQEPFLFSKSIYDNLTISDPSINKEKVYKSTEIASIHNVINEFDQGYNTLVGEKGVTLSGGQKQRIAIARTIINECPILVFDDSLSAVDSKTDAAIRNSLRSLGANLTMIIITQRTTSAMDADRIFVIEDGKLSQEGNHQELINIDGLYKRVYELQTRMKGDINE